MMCQGLKLDAILECLESLLSKGLLHVILGLGGLNQVDRSSSC